jgi:hypothetical protein
VEGWKSFEDIKIIRKSKKISTIQIKKLSYDRPNPFGKNNQKCHRLFNKN